MSRNRDQASAPPKHVSPSRSDPPVSHLTPPPGLLEDILDAFSDTGILFLDTDGHIAFANPAAEAIYGYPKAGLLGQLGREILETPSLSEMEELEDFLSHSDETEKLEFDLPQKRKNGEVFPARVRFCPCHARIEGTLVLVSELEAKAGVEQLKRDFLSLVSHELRTPLTSIKGAISMLRTGALGPSTPEQEKFLGIVDRNCERLGHLIASLLDLTRLEAGRLHLRSAAVNVDKLLREVERHVSDQYAEKEIQFEHLQSSEPIRAQADPAQLEQILLSLLDNAFKFTPRGGRVTTSITATNEEVCIRISDTGIGIPPEEQNRIFEKFYQIDSSLTRNVGGAGLGLYMARKLVKMHRGRIWVNSTPGKGSTFYVALPRTA